MICLDDDFCGVGPTSGNERDILAAYWHDIDFRGGNGGFVVTVHESTATDEISVKLFNQTKNYLEKYANVTNFSPTTIVLATWYKGTPYPHVYYLGKDEVRQLYKALFTLHKLPQDSLCSVNRAYELLYRRTTGDLLLMSVFNFCYYFHCVSVN